LEYYQQVKSQMDQTLKVWDVESGQCLRTLEGHTSRVYSVALSADGRRAVSGSLDKTLKAWDVEHGRLLATFECEGGWVICCAMSAKGDLIVAGDYSGRVHFLKLMSAPE
jgi:WD40 repeat protein